MLAIRVPLLRCSCFDNCDTMRAHATRYWASGREMRPGQGCFLVDECRTLRASTGVALPVVVVLLLAVVLLLLLLWWAVAGGGGVAAVVALLLWWCYLDN